MLRGFRLGKPDFVPTLDPAGQLTATIHPSAIRPAGDRNGVGHRSMR